MKLIRNSEVKIKLWEELLASSIFSSPFQTPQFYRFLNESTDSISANVFAIEDRNAYCALAVVANYRGKGIRGHFSKRSITYGGPLFTTDSKKSIHFLLSSLTDLYKKKSIYLEIRNFFDYSGFKNIFIENGFHYIPWINFQCSTTDQDIILKNLNTTRRRQLSKSIKTGATWKPANSATEISAFYKILNNLYSSKVRKPMPPIDFFQAAFKSDIFKFLLIHFQNTIIGGVMCAILPQKNLYEYYICGLDEEYKQQYPSIHATWAAMEYAHQNHIPYFDFMGAGSPDADYGVREFKSRFGGTKVEFGRYIKIFNPILYKIGKTAIHLKSKRIL